MNQKVKSLMKDSKRLFKESEKLALDAEAIFLSAIELAARDILLKYPILTEYLQAMGDSFFTIEYPLLDGTTSGEKSIGRTNTEREIDQALQAYEDYEKYGSEPSYDSSFVPSAEAVRQLKGAQKDIMEFYEKIFIPGNDMLQDMGGGSLAGTPMRFTAKGRKVTEW